MMSTISLRPYQNDAATFLYERDTAMVLAPVGSGKTALTLTALRDMVREGYAQRVLVIAPLRVAKAVWPVEAAKWAPTLSVNLACGSPNQRLAALIEDSDIVVTNYDNLQWLAEQDLPQFDIVVFDELTRMKNPSGKRFKAFEKLVKNIPIRWGLTGSFTSNGLEDVFGQCKIIDTKMLGHRKGVFMQQHFSCSRYAGFDDWTPLPGALERVMDRIKPWTFRLEAGAYSVPDLNTVRVPVSMPMDAYKQMKEEFVLQFANDAAVAQSAAVVTQKLAQLASGFVYTEAGSRWLSDHKYDALDDLLAENQRAPTIVWYQYKEQLAELRRRYPHARTLEGDAIDRWNEGRVELLLAHPASAGHGLNLQHGGCHMVWLSLPWSLELYEQAIGRLHRSGQKHPVWNYLLLTDGTIDQLILDSLTAKRALSDLALEALK